MSREKFIPQPVWNKPDDPGGGSDDGPDDNENPEVPIAPEGWVSLWGAARQLRGILGRKVHREGLKPYIDTTVARLGPGHLLEKARRPGVAPVPHYSPEVVAAAIAAYQETPFAPPKWATLESATEKLRREVKVPSMSSKTLVPYLEVACAQLGSEHYLAKARHRQTGSVISHYSPEVVAAAIAAYKREVAVAPEGWVTLSEATRQLRNVEKRKSIGIKTFQPYLNMAVSNFGKDHFLERARRVGGGGEPVPHYSPRVVAAALKAYRETPFTPPGWYTLRSATNYLKQTEKIRTNEATFKRYLDSAVVDLGENHFLARARRRGDSVPNYSPEVVTAAIAAYMSEIPFAPQDWVSVNGATKQLFSILGRTDVDPATFKRYLDSAVVDLGENHFLARARGRTTGPPSPHFSPEVVATAIARYQEANLILAKEKKQKALAELDTTYLDPNAPEGRAYHELGFALGPEALRDLLYAMRAELARLPVKDFDGRLAKYLGEYRPPRPFPLAPIIDRLVPLLENARLQEILLASIKRECQRSYFQARKASEPPDPAPIRAYFSELRTHVTASSPALEDVLTKAENYFLTEIFGDIPLSERVAPFLREDRPFPDIYQRINISEIRTHQRFLIADEMGVGKSASAVLAKESMGMKCALVIVPAAVRDMWDGYLSDKTENGRQIGYFKQGQAPNTLLVETSEDLERLETESFEYVVVSREMLTRKNTGILQQLPFDMLIVDEVHQHKKGDRGVWSKNLLELAEKIDGPEKRLVLLSGTPVPNKVKDVAVLIKLLDPNFANESTGSLTRAIVKGDVLAPRANLLPLMQMKSLADHVEMPNLSIERVPVQLSPEELHEYDNLLNTDGFEPQVKMFLLRKFLLNPVSIMDVPATESSKAKALKNELTEALKTKRKIVVFVNDYIDGVIRGENNIIEKLELPENVQKYFVHGEDKETGLSRADQRRSFQDDERPSVMFVSGQAEGVGNDYSFADHVIFYNEPWSQALFQQQLARVYRPGLKNDLTCRVLVTEGTIEEGITEYVRSKYDAIHKLLTGVPLTREQHEILLRDAEDEGPDELEVNPELPAYYESRFAQIMRLFSRTKERGQAQFLEALGDEGRAYGEVYEMFGGRSYQDNAARACSNIIRIMAEERGQDAPDVFDIGSGPAMLFRRAPESFQKKIESLDLNRWHFEGKKLGMTIVGSMADIPFPDDEHFDYANISFAIQDTEYRPEEGKYERIHAFAEAARMLRMNGRLLINMMYTLDFRDETALAQALEKFGLRVAPEFTGEVVSGENYKSRVLAYEKEKDSETGPDEIIATLSPKELNAFRFLSSDKQKKQLRIRKRPTQRDRIMQTFILGNKQIAIQFNADDSKIRNEEQRIIDDVARMKRDDSTTGDIKGIAKEVLLEKGYSRIKGGKEYKLFTQVPGDGLITID